MRVNWVGWGVVAGGLLVFGVLAWQVHGEATPGATFFDRPIAEAAQKHANEHDDVLHFARNATHYGGTQAMVTLAVGGALLLLICGHCKLAAIWLVAALLGTMINNRTKDFFERSRPEAALRDRSVAESSTSYPSGHAMGSTIGYGTMACVGFVLLRRRWAKVALAAAMVMCTVVVCWTRVYLRAHWCCDVVGGAALGLSWLALCFTLASMHGNK